MFWPAKKSLCAVGVEWSWSNVRYVRRTTHPMMYPRIWAVQEAKKISGCAWNIRLSFFWTPRRAVWTHSRWRSRKPDGRRRCAPATWASRGPSPWGAAFVEPLSSFAAPLLGRIKTLTATTHVCSMWLTWARLARGTDWGKERGSYFLSLGWANA